MGVLEGEGLVPRCEHVGVHAAGLGWGEGYGEGLKLTRASVSYSCEGLPGRVVLVLHWSEWG